jgi:hypothetical protein
MQLKIKQLSTKRDFEESAYLEKILNIYRGGLAFENNITDYCIKHQDPSASKQNQELMKKSLNNYLSQIINYYTGVLFSNGFEITSMKKVPKWIGSFKENANGVGTDLHDLVRECFSSALVCGSGYAAVTVPTTKEELTQLEYEKAGLDVPIVKLYSEDCLVDYHEADNGELEWIIFQTKEKYRPTILNDKYMIRYCWHVYDKKGYYRYENIVDGMYGFDPEKSLTPVLEIKHDLGVVQIARICLPKNLVLGDKLYPLQLRHLLLNSMLSWIISRNANPLPIMMMENPGLLDSQDMRYGLVLGQNDKYDTSPDTLGSISGLLSVIEDCKNELYRVANLNNLSSSDTVEISGVSKMVDLNAANQSLKAYSSIISEFVLDILKLASKMNNSKVDEVNVNLFLGDNYDLEVTSRILTQLKIDVSIPDIAKKEISKKYVNVLLPALDEKTKQKIFDEIDKEDLQPKEDLPIENVVIKEDVIKEEEDVIEEKGEEDGKK